MIRAVFSLLLLALGEACLRAEIDASRDTVPKQFQGAPGFFKGGFLLEGSKKRFEGANELNLDSFRTGLTATPGELSLKKINDPEPGDQISLKFTVTNESDAGTFLYFPTSQRCEAQIRNSEGKILYTWSEDFDFAAEVGYSFLNPGEKVNYQLTIPLQVLRGKLSSGGATLTANLVNYPQLQAELPLTIDP